jgi:putative peptide zinc metalloprotease protein
MSALDGQSKLQRLRGDLQLVSAEADTACTVFDPVRNRFFRLDSVAARMLRVWPECRTAEHLIEACDARFGLVLAQSSVDSFGRWLAANELTDSTDHEVWRAKAAMAARRRRGWIVWAIHNYLFVKIPLLSPQRALEALGPWLTPFFTRSFFLVIALCGGLGLHLAVREWDRLVAALPELFSLQASVLFVVGVAIVKSLHELGHAATAVRFGCRVPSMGVCFMVLLPMLYTDVSDAWKLSSRRERLLIDAAGLIVELCIACVAILMWVVLPEGPLKSIAAMLATTSILLSLGLNLNPFMRFDGYYILSDFIGIENLQDRSFALGSWKLREWLFGLGAAPPERFRARMMVGLIAYAWAVWVYRLILFTGIALFVYQMSFKLLGIALFIIEIVYFVVLPLSREAREWWSMRKAIIAKRRILVTATIAASAMLALFLPWSSRIDIPAIVEDIELAQLYPKRAAYVGEMGAIRGATVERGSLIASLISPELDQEIVLTKLKLKQTRRRLGRRPGDAEDLAQSHVLEQALAGLVSRLAGLEAERDELRIVSPIEGFVAEMDPHIRPQRWLQREDLVAVVRGGRVNVVRGYLSEDDVARIDIEAAATFVPERLDQGTTSAKISYVSAVGTGMLDVLELASPYGGAVAARPQQRPGEPRQFTPVTGQFLVTAAIPGGGGSVGGQIQRGVLHATGRPESMAARTWRHILKVLVRESGF